MRVITLNKLEFERTCHDLSRHIGESALKFDCIVSIANGGVYVGNEINKYLKLPHFTVLLQRSTTRRKSSFKSMLKRLPTWLTDRLRLIESFISRHCSHSGKDAVPVEIPVELQAFLVDADKDKCVLIVDDAIDSGSTVQSVEETIKKQFPLTEIKIAVINVTQKRSLNIKDFSAYNECVLIRFPWSLDFKL